MRASIEYVLQDASADDMSVNERVPPNSLSLLLSQHVFRDGVEHHVHFSEACFAIRAFARVTVEV